MVLVVVILYQYRGLLMVLVQSLPSFWTPFSTDYSIVVDGAGTHSSTLTIPGDSTALNGTTVECQASGFINGELFGDTDSDTLYIQGIHIVFQHV